MNGCVKFERYAKIFCKVVQRTQRKDAEDRLGADEVRYNGVQSAIAATADHDANAVFYGGTCCDRQLVTIFCQRYPCFDTGLGKLANKLCYPFFIAATASGTWGKVASTASIGTGLTGFVSLASHRPF